MRTLTGQVGFPLDSRSLPDPAWPRVVFAPPLLWPLYYLFSFVTKLDASDPVTLYGIPSQNNRKNLYYSEEVTKSYFLKFLFHRLPFLLCLTGKCLPKAFYQALLNCSKIDISNKYWCDLDVALDRIELIARGLLRAQELSGHQTPIVSLLDNDQLKALSPEERVEVIKRYARLKGQNSEYDGPSAASQVWSSAKTGMALAFPLALVSGKLTAPTLKVLNKAKTWKAWKNIGIKTGAPILATAAAGAVVGSTAGLLQHSATSGTNKFLNQVSNMIAASKTEEEADVNAAALMASTPHMSKGFFASQGMGHQYTMANLPHAVSNLTNAANTAVHSYEGKISNVPDWARRRYKVSPTKEYLERFHSARDVDVRHPQVQAAIAKQVQESGGAQESDRRMLPMTDPGNRWDYVKGIGWIKN